MPTSAYPQLSDEVLKAAWLERFSRFVEWPEESGINDVSKPFVITVIGKNPFGKVLNHLYSTRKIKNKKVEIRNISEPDQISVCHILFISGSMKRNLHKVISVTRSKPILTIGDTRGYAKKKVHINLLHPKKKEFPFEINVKAATESGLVIDSIILDWAVIVK
ncbi:MAG: YfiR family protein [Desulfobacterales bacterium]|nr:YfiR family protein [Desulfobacterales bacterium]